MAFEIELDDLLDFSPNSDGMPPESAQRGVLNAYKEESENNLRTTASNQGYANSQVSLTNMGQLMMGIPLYKDPSIPVGQNEFLQSQLLGTSLAVNDPNRKGGDYSIGAGFDELVPSDVKKLAQDIGPINVDGLLTIGDDGTIGGSSGGGGTGTGTGAGGGTAGQVPGDTNEIKIWNALRKAGLSKEQTAGVMGNLYQESANTWDPRVVEFGWPNGHGGTSRAGKPETWSDTIPPNTNSAGQPGYGICQWTSPGRKQGLQQFCDSNGLKVNSIEGQIGFLLHELQTGFKVSTWEPLKATNDINEATKIFLYHFEAGAAAGREPSAGFRQYLPARQGFAKAEYDKFANKEVGGQVPATSGGTGSAPAAAGQGATGLNISTDTIRNWWGPECYHGPMTTITLNGGAKVPVHPKVVAAATALNSALIKANYKARPGYTSSYNCRAITGGTKKSLHSYGIAIDINSDKNPYGRQLITDMPASMVAAIKNIRTKNGKQVWRWGGDYTTNHDAMHFEIICSQQDIDTGLDPATIP